MHPNRLSSVVEFRVQGVREADGRAYGSRRTAACRGALNEEDLAEVGGCNPF